MVIQNLRERHPLLIEFLEQNGYTISYVIKFKKMIRHILCYAETKKWRNYTEVYLSFVNRHLSTSYLLESRNIIGAIERFDLEGLYPSRLHRSSIMRKSSHDLLSSEFKKVIDTYSEIEKSKGKKEKAIYVAARQATTFLLEFQKLNIYSLEKVTESAVLSLFYREGKVCRSRTYRNYVATVFEACSPFFQDGVLRRIISYLPHIRDKRKNIQYLTKLEISDIKDALTKKDSPLCLRDKAICLTALYTGLRSCDMAAMRLSDIDWTNDVIHFRQQKTGIPLKLPLLATTGNAIYEYIMKERPKTESQEVFISQKRPFIGLKGKSMYNISIHIMEAANIRLKLGERGGFHLFRHNITATLLGNGISQPMISQILGHSSPASLSPYLNADFTHLKECSISIERFPIRKEVLL